MISVIIPVYRGESVIRACLMSVRAAGESVSVEAIVVNDCSPDSCAEIVRSEFPEVTLISNDRNRGYAHAVNCGIVRAAGEILLMLNQDTVLLPGSLRILAESLDANTDLSAVAPQLVYPSGKVQKSCRALPRHLDVIFSHLLLSSFFPHSKIYCRWKMGWFDHESAMRVEQPSFSALLLRREVIDQIGLLDESFEIFFNDVDFCRRMFDAGMVVRFEPGAKVRHLLGQSTSQVPFRKILNSHKNFIRYFFKHYRGIGYLIPNLLVALLLIISGILRLGWQAIKSPFTSATTSS